MSCRAGLMDPFESHMVDRHGEPIGTCRVMTIGDRVQGTPRLFELARPALAEALASWRQALDERRVASQPLPLCAALPYPHRPGVDPSLHRSLVRQLVETAPGILDAGRATAISACRGGGVAAMRWALDTLASGAPAVVVGGVDSYFDPDVLEQLDEDRRLHGLDNENGFIPGEGAAFLVMTRPESTGGLFPVARVCSAATTLEPHAWQANAPADAEPCLGRGMTEAVARAVDGMEARSIGWLLTDVANERHRVDEWTYAWLRNDGAFTHDAQHEQPLLETGDVGAASAAMLSVLAAVRWQTRCGVAARALVATHSDGPERGAFVLEDAR